MKKNKKGKAGKGSSKPVAEPKKARKAVKDEVGAKRKKGNSTASMDAVDWANPDKAGYIKGTKENLKRRSEGDVYKWPEGDTLFYVCPAAFPDDEEIAYPVSMNRNIGAKHISVPVMDISQNPILAHERVQKHLKFKLPKEDPVQAALKRGEISQEQLKAADVWVGAQRFLINIVPVAFRQNSDQPWSPLKPQVRTIELSWKFYKKILGFVFEGGRVIFDVKATTFLVMNRVGTNLNTAYDVSIDRETDRAPLDLREKKSGRRLIEAVTAMIGNEGGPNDPYAIIAKRCRPASEVEAALLTIGKEEGDDDDDTKVEEDDEENDMFGKASAKAKAATKKAAAEPKAAGKKKSSPVVEEEDEDDEDEDEEDEEDAEDDELDDDEDDDSDGDDEDSDEDDEESDDEDDEDEESDDEDDEDEESDDEDEDDEDDDSDDEDDEDDEDEDDLPDFDFDEDDEDEDDEDDKPAPKKGKGKKVAPPAKAGKKAKAAGKKKR